MRNLVLAIIALLLLGCGNGEPPDAGSTASGPMAALPAPSELSRLAPPRAASGSYSPLVRTLRSDGAEYIPWPGWSNNAEVSGDDALIHGGTGTLNYVMFQLGSIVDTGDTLTQLRLDYSWDMEPTAPEGLYVGLPDHANDRWVWLDAAEAQGKLLDIAGNAIHGRDAPGSSYIALVNYSSSEATIDKLALRFRTPETVSGDEWLYFSAINVVPGPPSIIRRQPMGGDPEVILTSDTSENGVPEVINYAGEWKINFARSWTYPPQLWRCDIDGSNEVVIDDTTAANPAGHLYGTDRGLFIHAVPGPLYELWVYGPDGQGRLTRDIDMVSQACWDLWANPTLQYAAIASLRYDDVNYYYSLVSISGNPPFPIDDTPVEVYTRLANEDAREPEMFELATLAGDPLYYIYFSARNRDDATYNIYRVRYPGYEPEPVVVDAAYELRWVSVSPSGEWLAYSRQPAGADQWDLGEIVVISLLDPTAPHTVLQEDTLYSFSWYDPTP